MTAKTTDGKEFYRNQVIYMPTPQQMGRGDKMGRGPYEKSGMIHDSSLPPLRTTQEKFEIPVYIESTKDGKTVRTIIANDFVVDVEISYLPYGKKEDPGNNQKWVSISKKLSIEKGGK